MCDYICFILIIFQNLKKNINNIEVKGLWPPYRAHKVRISWFPAVCVQTERVVEKVEDVGWSESGSKCSSVLQKRPRLKRRALKAGLPSDGAACSLWSVDMKIGDIILPQITAIKEKNIKDKIMKGRREGWNRVKQVMWRGTRVTNIRTFSTRVPRHSSLCAQRCRWMGRCENCSLFRQVAGRSLYSLETRFIRCELGLKKETAAAGCED